MFKTIQTIVMAMLCLNFSSSAQVPIKPPPLKNQGVMGKVISSSTNESLPGALIKIAATNFTVVSNEKGEFNLSLANGTYNLAVHYLTYKTRNITIEIPLKDKLIITLEPADQNLKEVEINAGYYTVKDRERTGSISKITSETIGRQPINNPLQALQGFVPGVEIVQSTGLPGGSFAVRIRGQNSIGNGNDPLYVIDGVQISNAPLASTIGQSITPNSSPLNTINPSNIESIEVLKDADATAIYGSRGANGVILITTKKAKSGELQFSTNLYHGVGTVTRKIDLLNTAEYIEMRKEAFTNDNVSPGAADYDINGTWDQTRYTDWQNELIGGTASSSNAQISISGGNSNTSFLTNAGYYRETTVFPGNNSYQKKSVLLNINHISNNQKIKIQSTAEYNTDYSNLPLTDLIGGIMLAPNAPALYTPSGEINWENGTFFNNPIAQLKRDFNVTNRTVNGSFNLSYKITPSLEATARAGYVYMQRNEIATTPLTFFDPATNPVSNSRRASFSNNWSQTLNLEPQLSWKRNLWKGELNILIGATILQNELHKEMLSTRGFASDGLLKNISAAATITPSGVSNAEYRYLSTFGRINYKLKDKYIFNFTGRRDGSTRFGKDNIFANFGAVGAAWIFSNESFMSSLSFLSFGKLRASYGVTGNDQIGDYSYLELWNPTTYTYQTQAGLTPLRISNPNYSWEVNKKAEIAIELRTPNDRFQFQAAYYRNRSSNQLINYGLPPSAGFPSILANFPAIVQNEGAEFEFLSNIFNGKKFRWHISSNLSLPRNKLLEFPDLLTSYYASTYVVGKPLNILKVLELSEVNKDTGLYKFTDFDNNGMVSPVDRQIIKELGQKFSGGIHNNIAYKDFELNISFQFVKQTGRNAIANIGVAPGGFYNQPDYVLNRWSQVGDITDVQRYTISSGTQQYANSRPGLSISDASFIRLKNLALSYKLSQKGINRLGIESLKIYIQAQNLLTLTSFNGLDPESQNLNSLPPLSMIVTGIHLLF